MLQHIVYSGPVHGQQYRVRFLRGLTRWACLRGPVQYFHVRLVPGCNQARVN